MSYANKLNLAYDQLNKREKPQKRMEKNCWCTFFMWVT